MPFFITLPRLLGIQTFLAGTCWTWWCGSSTSDEITHFFGAFFKIALTLSSLKPTTSRGKVFCLIYQIKLSTERYFDQQLPSVSHTLFTLMFNKNVILFSKRKYLHICSWHYFTYICMYYLNVTNTNTEKEKMFIWCEILLSTSKYLDKFVTGTQKHFHDQPRCRRLSPDLLNTLQFKLLSITFMD